MRFPPSAATFGVAFALVNLGLLAYMGAPLPPQPWLSILIIVVVNLLLVAYTPSIISLLGGSQSRRAEGYQAPLEHQMTAAEERMIRRTRVLIFIETYIAFFLRGSFKDGQYTDEYHNMAFMMLACAFGIWGGMACIISEYLQLCCKMIIICLLNCLSLRQCGWQIRLFSRLCRICKPLPKSRISKRDRMVSTSRSIRYRSRRARDQGQSDTNNPWPPSTSVL